MKIRQNRLVKWTGHCPQPISEAGALHPRLIGFCAYYIELDLVGDQTGLFALSCLY
jgi:hypothetical protein